MNCGSVTGAQTPTFGMKVRLTTDLSAALTSTPFLSTLPHNGHTAFSIDINQKQQIHPIRTSFLWILGQYAQVKWQICNQNNATEAGGQKSSTFSHSLICHPLHCPLNWSTMLWEFSVHPMFQVYHFFPHHILAHHNSSPPRCPFWCGQC